MKIKEWLKNKRIARKNRKKQDKPRKYLWYMLWEYLFKKKLMTIAIIVLNLVIVLLNDAVAVLFSILVEDIISSNKNKFNIVLIWIIVVCSAYIINAVFSCLFSFIFKKMYMKIGYQIKKKLLSKSQILYFSYLNNSSGKALTKKCITDISFLVEIFSENMGDCFICYMNIFIIGAILFLFSPIVLAIFVGTFAIVFAWIVIKENKTIFKNNTNRIATNDCTNFQKTNLNKLNESIIKKFKRWEIAWKVYNSLEKKCEFIKNTLLVFFVTIIVVLYQINFDMLFSYFPFLNILLINLGYYNYQVVSFSLSQPWIIVVLIFLVEQFFSNFFRLLTKTNLLLLASTYSSWIYAVLDETNTDEKHAEENFPLNHTPKISFNHITTFQMNSKTKTLNDINFELNAGTKTAIVSLTENEGWNIVNLLANFYYVNSGTITINEKDISKYTNQSLRENISIISRNHILLPLTIKDNILLEREEINSKIIEDIIKNLGIWDKIQNLPHKLDTVINDEEEFSEEERQLILIARALLSKAKILVIDETDSWDDLKNKDQIHKFLNLLVRNHTTIFITNSLETTKEANKILVMRKCEIVEQGNHEELMIKNKYYVSLVQTWENFN